MITSTDLVGCPTHFYGGRTVPCEKEKCEPCDAGVQWRWHGYVSAYQVREKLHFLFESTARAAEVLKTYRKAHGSLRGCVFEATRPSGSINGRVHLRTKPTDLEGIWIPEAPDLELLLCIIWNVPSTAVSTEGQLKGHPHLHVGPTSKSNGDHKLPIEPRTPATA